MNRKTQYKFERKFVYIQMCIYIYIHAYISICICLIKIGSLPFQLRNHQSKDLQRHQWWKKWTRCREGCRSCRTWWPVIWGMRCRVRMWKKLHWLVDTGFFCSHVSDMFFQVAAAAEDAAEKARLWKADMVAEFCNDSHRIFSKWDSLVGLPVFAKQVGIFSCPYALKKQTGCRDCGLTC